MIIPRYLAMAALVFAVMLALLGVPPASAQSVIALPTYIDNGGAVSDLGNGPIKLQSLTGQAAAFTSSGSGVGSGTTTAITLTATAAANPPCVGCVISGIGVQAGTIVTAFNGTTGITTNVSQTIAASTALAWGKACPTTPAVGQRSALFGPTTPLSFWTFARVCGYAAAGQSGAQVMISAVNTLN